MYTLSFAVSLLLGALARFLACRLDADPQIEKSAIKDLINATPNIPQNAGLIGRLKKMLAAKRILRDPFFYTANIASLAAGANTTNNINIQADSDFLIQALAYMADVAQGAQTQSSQVIPLCTVLLTDSGSGRQFMDSDSPVNAIMGMNGSQPFILPQPKLMAARSTLVVKTTNYSAATTYAIRYVFFGVKLFSLG
jgi:hypothetical protein